ncbi:group-specific protein [Lactobacillus rossiae]|uniref:Group-specific protein n=1 Tax=Furfurilactobacillus milii TaxID=2888272 RepID=A0A6N9I4L3_9LACO|nr:group-specific protein [Furfurilactobacillus milii]
MNYYIASSFAHISLVREVAARLDQSGCQNVYDWTVNEANTLEALQKIGIHEKMAVMSCDVFIMIYPAGKGANTELGLALAANRKIYIYATNHDIWNVAKTSTFYQLPEVTIVSDSIAKLTALVLDTAN